MTNEAKIVTDILNSTITATYTIIPLEVTIGEPTRVETYDTIVNYSLIIGVVGDAEGSIIIEADDKTLKDISQEMFNVDVEGDILISFFGELGNILVGSISTEAEKMGYTIDITPPTIMIGKIAIQGYTKAVRLPLYFGTSPDASMYISLAIGERAKKPTYLRTKQ